MSSTRAISQSTREEPDALSSTASTPEAGSIFINRNLFSSYYLGTLLAREVRQHQGETGTRMAQSVRRRLHSLWDRVVPSLGHSTSFARTRQAWLDPLLIALGYEPLEDACPSDFNEESLPHGYVFYRVTPATTPVAPPFEDDHENKDEEVEEIQSDESTPREGGVLLSLLSWGTDFDRPFTSMKRRSEMPHKLMERLLAAGPAQWGLLCNGQRLRLLKRNVVAGRQQYFEVDLESLFEHGSDRDFDTFWTLFRAQAFQPDSKGRCLLDVVDEGSRKHAEGVSSTLKGSVFRALETLMGVLVNRAREISRLPIADSDDTAQQRRRAAEQALNDLPRLYQQSLVLLYRLLFVLYAESRLLLPVDNAVYRDSYSLEPLRDEIMEPEASYLPNTFRLWETIQALFRLIHRGCNTTQLVVPAYNGDLFNPQTTALLNAIRVPDDALSQVLSELSVTPPTRERGRERIDYQDLGVEQLGSVYEGLLEYEPRIAAEPMVEVKYKDGRVVIPAREQRTYSVVRTFATGQFYLGRGAGRKTSGSYYTPQPLVDFLVRRTLGPLVQGKTPEQILELKVVDPAMGSGAFLVGACLFLADAYARALREQEISLRSAYAPDDGLSSDELQGHQQSLLDVDIPVDDELSEEATRPYRRLVAERCLYGVDLNPMAVELAKVSLWLTTLAGDKPLTFLDANLRWGNSLIGAPLRPYHGVSGREYSIDSIHPEANKRLLKERGTRSQRKSKGEDDAFQLALFDEEEIPETLQPLVGRRRWIAETPSDSVARVHEKAALFRKQVEQNEQRRILKTICDLWVATWFWRQPPASMKPDDPNWVPPLDGQIYRELVLQLRGEQRQLTTIALEPYLKELQHITEQVGPFHWELEFPEVYYDADGQLRSNAGFDAVLGNPPWDLVLQNSREFFAGYDPAFRELERKEADRRQEELLKDGEIQSTWNTYVQYIDAQVDYFKLSESYPYQTVVVDGKQAGGHANTYKLFLERAFGLLRQNGNCSLIVPSGLYTDHGCTGLRQLLFSRAQISYLLCFENKYEIFPIHRSFKFVLFGFCKQTTVRAFDATFMLHNLERLSAPEEDSLSVPAHLIHRFSPDTLSIMEFRSQKDIDLISHIYDGKPLLGENIKGTWNAVFAREFNMTDDRYLFNEKGIGWPVYEGKMIHQYTHCYSVPHYWIEAKQGIDEQARLEMQRIEEAIYSLVQKQYAGNYSTTRQGRIASLFRVNGRGPLTTDDVHVGAERDRIAFRDVSRNTDARTLIASIIPRSSFSVNTLSCLVSWQFDAQKAINGLQNIRDCYEPSIPSPIMAYLCGVFNSFTLDYVLRFKVTAHVNMFYLYQTPVPRLTSKDQHCKAIARRVAQLVCIGPEFDGLRAEVLGSVEAHVATEAEERQRLQNEIDALVAHLYGLSEEDMRHILYAPYTFPLVKRVVKDGVMEALGRVEELLEEEE